MTDVIPSNQRNALVELRDEMLREAEKTASCYTCYTDLAALVARRLTAALTVETEAPLTLGKLVLDTARGDVKERTLSPSEAESFHKALARSPRRTASPIAQAIDHIEKGGNLASGEVELRDGTLVELRMSRLPVKTSGEPT